MKHMGELGGKEKKNDISLFLFVNIIFDTNEDWRRSLDIYILPKILLMAK